MVRREGFKPPACWFVAFRSIELNCGRGLCSNDSGCCGQWQLGGGYGLGWRGRRWGCEADGFHDVQTGSAEELVDYGLGETGGVVFDPDGFRGFVELDVANAIDLADLGQGEGGRLGGRDSVAVEDV